MNQAKPASLVRRSTAVAGILAMGLMLTACKDKATDAPEATVSAPATPLASVTTAASDPAPAAQADQQLPSGATAAPRKIAMSVQGVSPSGVTVRVKAIDIGSDATVLDVSISFANRINASTMMALADTFLEDENHGRLQIKRPESNRNLRVSQGETLDGQLVFLGAVPASARKLKLIFNDGYQEDNIVAPGLMMELPLQDN